MRSIVLLCVINGSEDVNDLIHKSSKHDSGAYVSRGGFPDYNFDWPIRYAHDILIYSANSSIEQSAALKKIA